MDSATPTVPQESYIAARRFSQYSRGDWDTVVASVVSGAGAPTSIVWRGHQAPASLSRWKVLRPSEHCVAHRRKTGAALPMGR